MEWLSSDPLKAEMILWEMEKCRKYEDYIKLLDIYGNYLTTMLEQEKTLLTETIKEAAPKVEYFDKAMSSKSSYTTTQVAQEFGLSAKTLNARLAKMGVQYRQGGAWILYAKYQGNGYTHTVSVPYMMANGEQGTQIQTRWTEKGRKFLHDLMDGK